MRKLKSESFGRYEVLAELGRGAMGVVYKARDPRINRLVAIKTISMAGQPPEDVREYRERFFREAEAAGRISHPGIVTIFDVGQEPESLEPYIVMEFVGGQSLDKLLTGEARKLPLDLALQLAHELAEALDCAHSQGVVHRDLKPANILLTEDGHAKIADFGVAKLNLANHTLAGRALGTPAYMSPEQLNGEAVDGRSDLFSLGVVLYTMVTGHRPFQGNSALTVSFKVVNRDPIPASILESQLPPGIDYVIAKAMTKNPAERYQRGTEMALDIQDLREGRELRSKGQAISPAQAPPPAQGAKRPAASATLTGAPNRHAKHKELEFIRKRTFAMMLLLGLALVAVGVSRSLWPKVTSKQSQRENAPAPLPAVGSIDLANPIKAPMLAQAVTPPAPSAPHLKRAARPAVASVQKTLKAQASAQPVQIKAVSLTANSPAPSIPPATLEIDVEHKFAQAKLTVWIDDQVNYIHTLEGTHKRVLGVFHHSEGHEFHALQIPPGNHQLRIEVSSGEPPLDQATTVSANFTSGDEKMLHVTFDKHGEMTLSLENDPSTQPPPKAP